MAAGKWIPDLSAETPLDDATRRVLTVRLEVVRDYLPLAIHESDKDPEDVHQLRVGTRRARAALDIFEPCLPAKIYKKTRKGLRRIRRAAGDARDWDVFLASLTAWAQQQISKHRPGLDFLIGHSLAQRQLAQAQLETAGQEHPFTFDRLLAETVAAVRKPEAPHLRTLLDLALPVLTGLLEELDHAAAGDLEDYARLHEVRIIGKRLRYAMEVFAECFAPAFREQSYPAVEEMQEILGNANDSHVACQRLGAIAARLQTMPKEWNRYRPGLNGLLRFHQERLPQERQHFREWWVRWQQSGSKGAFAALLKTSQQATS